jgi:MFS family permease
VCRFLAAAAGSPSLAIGGGSVADLWDMSEGGAMAAILVVQTFFLGPSLGPLIGGYALETRGSWRWLMWVMLLVTGPLYLTIFFTKETSHKEILRRRAVKRGISQPPQPSPAAALKMLVQITFLRPVKMLVAEPIVSFMALYTSYAFGVLFALFTAYPYIFMGVYGFTTGETGLAFLGIFIGTLLAVLTFFIFDRTVYQKARSRAPPGKSPAPEERLYTSMVGSFGIPISLFGIAWTSRPDIHWIVPVVAGVPFGWGMSSLFVCLPFQPFSTPLIPQPSKSQNQM